jgi:polyisoprenoid-binding protein YceI
MKTILHRLLLAFVALGATGLTFAADTWKIDPAHSSVGFTIRHAFTKIPGSFAKFEGTISYDATNPAASSAEAKIEVASITTNDAKRDTHLQKDDFFSADKFPSITFKSKSWKKTGDDAFDVTGDLTIKDVTKEVVIATKFLGTGPGPKKGSILAGFEGTTKIDRRDFGITYGQGLVGNDVNITINIEAAKQ